MPWWKGAQAPWKREKDAHLRLEGFLEEVASMLSLERHIGIFWKKGKGKREEHCRCMPRRENSMWNGKLHLLCIFRDTV